MVDIDAVYHIHGTDPWHSGFTLTIGIPKHFGYGGLSQSIASGRTRIAVLKTWPGEAVTAALVNQVTSSSGWAFKRSGLGRPPPEDDQ